MWLRSNKARKLTEYFVVPCGLCLTLNGNCDASHFIFLMTLRSISMAITTWEYWMLTPCAFNNHLICCWFDSFFNLLLIWQPNSAHSAVNGPVCIITIMPFWGDWDRRWITGSRRRDSYSSTARRCSRARFSPRACSDARCCSDATWRRCSSTSGEFVWWPAASWTTQQTSDAPSYLNPRQSGSHGSKRSQKTFASDYATGSEPWAQSVRIFFV